MEVATQSLSNKVYIYMILPTSFYITCLSNYVYI